MLRRCVSITRLATLPPGRAAHRAISVHVAKHPLHRYRDTAMAPCQMRKSIESKAQYDFCIGLMLILVTSAVHGRVTALTTTLATSAGCKSNSGR